MTGKKERTMAVIGAGRGQVGLVEAASKLARVAVVTMPGPKLPAAAAADLVIHADITDHEAVEAAVAGLRLDGVATSCLDKGMRSLGRVRDRKELTGPSEEAAAKCNHKIRMKEALDKGDVRTARYRVVSDLQEARAAAEELGFPCVVKAPDLNGSMGVRVVRSAEGLGPATDFVMGITKEGRVLVEEFLDGFEIGAQALVQKGEVLFVLPHADQMHPDHPTVPIGHSVPLRIEEGISRQVDEQVRAAVAAMGLDDCAVNVDIMVVDGEVHIIELTGRVGANGLPEMVSEYFGIDYYEVIARLALGEDVSSYFANLPLTPPAVAVRMLSSLDSGTLKEIDCDPAGLVSHSLFVGPGDTVNRFQDSSHCIGQAVAAAETPGEAFDVLDAFEGSLTLSMEA